MSEVIHVLRVPEHEIARRPDGEPRWCFVCRRRVPFEQFVFAPTDELSYYGVRPEIRCERGHRDGDCFPGSWREWGGSDE